MKRALRIIGWFLLVAVLAGGAYWVYATRLAPSATTAGSANASGTFIQTVPVTKGSLSSNLTVVGQLQAVQSADLNFSRMNSTAKLASLAVKAGTTVTNGQVLATIDPAPYQQALDQANSTLAAAQKTLADLKTPPTDLQLAQADLAISQADQDLAQANKNLADLQAPDIASLKNAVQNAQDQLAADKVQAPLLERDANAKSERDLQYAVGWHQRKIAQLEVIVASHKANKEQTDLLATEQDTLGQAQADLARISAERRLAIDAAAATVASDEAALKTAQDALTQAQAGGDPITLAQDKLAIHIAQVAQIKAKSDKDTLVGGPDAVTLASDQATVDKAALDVSNAEADLAATKLVAPFDGTILKVNNNRGDLISASNTILSLANLKELQVYAAIDEVTIRRVATGQNVNITFDAFPGQVFKGKVVDVPLDGTLQGGVTVYSVPISLTGAEKLPLLVGMTANAQIQLGSAANALLVPAMAIQSSNGSYQVLIADPANPNAPPQSVPVQIGLSDGTNTQITGGLNEGDQVVVQLSNSTSNNNFRGGGGGVGGLQFLIRGR
jgi:HlyD family secretion protein